MVRERLGHYLAGPFYAAIYVVYATASSAAQLPFICRQRRSVVGRKCEYSFQPKVTARRLANVRSYPELRRRDSFYIRKIARAGVDPSATFTTSSCMS